MPQQNWYQDPNTLTAIGAAIFAGASALFAWLQVREARKAREDTRRLAEAGAEDAKKSAEASGRSAHAAELSAQTAREALKAQRAWVTILNVAYLNRTLGRIPLDAYMNFENGGSTPALDPELFCEMNVDDNMPEEMIFNKSGFRAIETASPRSVYKHYTELKTDPENFAHIINGSKKLYLYGCYRYLDVFGDMHATVWLYRYNPAEQRFVVHSGKHNYSS